MKTYLNSFIRAGTDLPSTKDTASKFEEFYSERTQKEIDRVIELTTDADLKKSKPPSSKGVFISKVSMSSTMGPGLEIDISSLNF